MLDHLETSDSLKKTARIAGALYLIVVLTGIFHLLYVPSLLSGAGDPSVTISNIIAHETLFRFSILAGILCYAAFLLLPLALYKLLSPTDRTHAVMMVALAVVSVPISLVNMLNKFAVLTLISKAGYLTGLEAGTLQAQISLHLDYYRNGNEVASIFWGLWLFPFGYLVFKSGFLPRFLGIFLMVGCVGYIIDFMGSFLFSSYNETIISTLLTIPGSIGEIGICLWLLIVGIKNKPAPWQTQTS
jgi:hypothetical protein